MEEAAISVAAEMFAKPVVDSVTTPFNYIWNYKSNLATLQDELRNLKSRRKDKQTKIDEAKRNGDGILELAQKWLDSADEKIKEAAKIIEYNERVNMQCFMNLCPNLKKRYVESKKAARMMEAVSNLYHKGSFETVSYRTLPAETWLPDGYEYIASRQSTLDAILVALRADYVNMVGVYGIGGSGKTTMVREVAKIAEEDPDPPFNKVVFVEVTDTVDIRKIQKVIAERLGSDFREDSECVIAGRLRDRIKQECKILLILDNIWNDLDLGAIGIPFGNNHMGCKLLLTSRDVNVLNEMGSKNNFPVDVLQEEEACNLFMKISGVGEEQRDLQALALEVAKECEGLLVAIVTIAKALRVKQKNDWKIALEELRNPPLIENVEESVVKKAYASIHLSYKHLESQTLRSIFLLCIMMVSMDAVSIEELFRYTVGLSLFKANAMEGVRERVKRSVQKLKDASLLLGTPNGETFSIHDVVHDVGRWIASNEKKYTVINDVVPRFLAAENALESCTSIILHNIVELPKSLKCPRLKFFYMKTKSKFTKVPDEFFNGMLNLEVLHLIEIDLSIVPRSLCLLKHLQTLNLDECCVGDIAEIKDMENLAILVIGGVNEIKQLPEEIGQLTSLRLLDLRKSSFIIPPKTISKLTQLEELYMDDWYGQQQVEELNIVISVASLEELKDLCNLTTLHIRVANAKVLPKSMVFERLKRYQIVIGNGDIWNIRETLRTLRVTSDTQVCSEDGVIKQLKGVEDLLLDGEQQIANVLCELDGEGFPTLKHFHIKNNLFIVCVVDLMLSATCVAFPLLETLSLYNLLRLKKICHDQFRTQCFCQLRTIKVEKCHELKSLFSFSIAKHLSVLEEIEVVDCEYIEEIFVVDRADDGVIDPVFFKKLHSLTLRWLPRLRRICSETEMGSICQERSSPMTTNASSSEIVLEDQRDALPLLGEKVIFPNLKNLVLHGVNVKRIWPDQLPSLSCWVQHLTKMSIKECSNLKYVLSSSTLGSFNHLQYLEIWDCEDLEELMRIDDRCSNHVEFPSLKRLEIWGCPELREFIFSDKVSYPSLQEIRIKFMKNLRRIWQSQVTLVECENLEILFPASIARSLLQLEVLDVRECGIKEIVAKEGGVEEAAARFSFPQLTSLYLDSLKELECFYPGKHTMRCPKLKKLRVSCCGKIYFLNSQKQDVEGQLDDDHTVMQQSLFSVDEAFFHLEKVTISGNHIGHCQSSFSKSLFPKLKSFVVEHDKSTSFPHRILENFHNLEELKLRFGTYKEIFSCEEVEKHVGLFAPLKRLHLSSLYELKQMWKQESKMDLIFQKLECLQVSMCDNLIDLMPSSASFKNLKILKVWGCGSLISLVPTSAAKSLMVLEEMSIEYCKEMVEIIANEGDLMEGEITLSKLKSLELDGLSNLTSFYSGNYTFNFPSLERLRVYRCSKLKFLTSKDLSAPNLKEVEREWTDYKCKHPDLNATIKQIYDEQVFHILEESFVSEKDLRLVWDVFPEQTKVFSNAKQLHLSGNGIEMMRRSQFPEHIFPKLKCLHVSWDESKVFSFEIFQRFHDVKKLELRYCSYEEIFSHERAEKYVWFLAQIKHLHLVSLSHAKNMWKKDFKLNLLPNLEGLKVEWCSGLTNVLLPSSSFENLKIMKVNTCRELISLMVVSTAKSLAQLEEMEICKCKMLTQVIVDEGDIAEDKITFHKLKKLKLDDLSCLTSFNSRNYILEIPLLEKLTMNECPKMKIFALGNLSTPMLREVWQDKTKYGCKDDLNKIVGQHHERKVFFILEKSILRKEDLRLVWDVFPEKTKVFSNAKQLHLIGNDIEMMWQSQFPEHIFPKLKCLHVSHDKSKVFPFGIFQRFVKEVELRCCSYEEIFSHEEGEKYGWFLAQIKRLHLYSLSDAKQMWKKDSKLNLLPNLEGLEVEWCSGLTNVLLPSSSFENLKIMKVNDCGELISLMVASTTKSLVQLEEMEICKCKMLTQVIANGGDIAEDKITFHKLKKLKLDDLSCLTSFNSGNYILEIPFLEKLTVNECPMIKIFALGNLSTPMLREVWQDETKYGCKDDLNKIVGQHHERKIFSRKKLGFESITMMLQKFPECQKVFCNLEQLSFRTEEICMLRQSQFPQQLFPEQQLFPNLELVEIFKDESTVFPLAILQRFQGVETLELNCSSYEEIFSCEDFDKYAGAFAQIKRLSLYELDNLKQMWKQDSSSDLILQNNIDNLQIEWCGSLVTLMPPSSSFQSLIYLTVKGCNGLMNLFAPATAKSLVQLEYMTIKKCETMTEVISSNEEGAADEEIIFSKLKDLYLGGLSSLTSFCPRNYTLSFPCLSYFSQEECCKMKFFSSGVLNTPNLDEIIVEGTKYYLDDNELNATIEWIHGKLNPRTSREDCAGPSTISSSAI